MRVTVRAEQSKVVRRIVLWVAVDMIKDERKRLRIPRERFRVVLAFTVIASLRQSLHTPPLAVDTKQGPWADPVHAVAEHVRFGSSRRTHGLAPDDKSTSNDAGKHVV